MQDEYLTVLKGLLSGGTVSYQAIFSKAFRSIPTGVYLSQMFFWQENSRYKSKETHQQIEGRTFICRTADEWFEETGMSAEQQSKARETLRPFGVLLEKRAGMPAKLWQHIDLESLVTVINRYLETGSPVTVDYRSKERLNTRASNGKFRQQVTVKNRPTYVESVESEEESVESIPTADAAAHNVGTYVVEIQSKKSKAPKLAAPDAPKSSGDEPKYNWTREAAKAFDEVAAEQCRSNGIEHSPFNWRVCSERNFGHLKNLREQAILPDLIAKRKQESGAMQTITEGDILKSLRSIFTEAWLFYHKKAQFAGGKMKYTPERIYIDYNEIKSQIIQRRANATSQRNTSTGYAPTPFNQGVGKIDPLLGF